jgi:hypothetical protein
MERLLKKIFVDNLQRKLIALFSAICIWFLVHHSITATRTFTHIPIRVVQLPSDKTIRGLMPNGILDRKLTLTLTGTKDMIERIEPGDFEVVIDAAGKPDEWIVQVAKKNLVSLNPDIDLVHNVTDLSQSEFVLRLSRLLTDKIPIYIAKPRGEPPEGYQFLDIWPQKLTHVVSGPEEDVKALQARGIELTFDLNDISRDDLDALVSEDPKQPDEVSYYVPESWKRVMIPFLHDMKQEINGPESKNLRIDFLRKELLALDRNMPIRVFYPLPTLAAINPQNHPFVPGENCVLNNGVVVLQQELFADDVSRLFLDIVRDNLEIVIIAQEKKPTEPLDSSVEFIGPQQLEETYVNLLFSASREATGKESAALNQSHREQYLRQRFRDYMQRFRLFASKDKPLEIEAFYNPRAIVMKKEERPSKNESKMME